MANSARFRLPFILHRAIAFSTSLILLNITSLIHNEELLTMAQPIDLTKPHRPINVGVILSMFLLSHDSTPFNIVQEDT